MTLGKLLGLSMVHLLVVSYQVQLGGHAHHHASQVAVHQLVLLAPEVVHVLHYVFAHVQLGVKKRVNLRIVLVENLKRFFWGIDTSYLCHQTILMDPIRRVLVKLHHTRTSCIVPCVQFSCESWQHKHYTLAQPYCSHKIIVMVCP